MPTMLKHKPTGDLYVFSEVMSQRGDMEIIDIPDIAPKVEIPVEQPKPKAKKPAKVEPVEVVVEESAAAAQQSEINFDNMFEG